MPRDLRRDKSINVSRRVHGRENADVNVKVSLEPLQIKAKCSPDITGWRSPEKWSFALRLLTIVILVWGYWVSVVPIVQKERLAEDVAILTTEKEQLQSKIGGLQEETEVLNSQIVALEERQNGLSRDLEAMMWKAFVAEFKQYSSIAWQADYSQISTKNWSRTSFNPDIIRPLDPYKNLLRALRQVQSGENDYPGYFFDRMQSHIESRRENLACETPNWLPMYNQFVRDSPRMLQETQTELRNAIANYRERMASEGVVADPPAEWIESERKSIQQRKESHALRDAYEMIIYSFKQCSSKRTQVISEIVDI